MPSLSVCKPIFYGSRRIFPFLGFAITNIIKLFNKSKFKGWYKGQNENSKSVEIGKAVKMQ